MLSVAMPTGDDYTWLSAFSPLDSVVAVIDEEARIKGSNRP